MQLPELTIEALRRILAAPDLSQWMERVAAGASVSHRDLDTVLKVAWAQKLIAEHEASPEVKTNAFVDALVNRAAGLG